MKTKLKTMALLVFLLVYYVPILRAKHQKPTGSRHIPHLDITIVH